MEPPSPPSPPQQQQQPQELQLAHVLSDLVSLRVCDPASALALVSARSSDTATTAPNLTPNDKPTEEQAGEDADLARAKNLVELHYKVKEAHQRGELAAGLFEARAMVKRAVGDWE